MKCLASMTVVRSQEALDTIPLDFNGQINIEFGDRLKPAVVKNRYYQNVVVDGNFSVVAQGNSRVVAQGTSYVVAQDNSYVVAQDNSSVYAWDDTFVEALSNSAVEAKGNSSVIACQRSRVFAREKSTVVAQGLSYVIATDDTFVEALDSSFVDANGNSHVVAFNTSFIVVSCNNSFVEANNNAQVLDEVQCDHIQITGNARIVNGPKTIEEYCLHYGVKHDKKMGIFYKAVHKIGDKYKSDHDRGFEYKIGENVKPDAFDRNRHAGCSNGIHVSYIDWALGFGQKWDDLAILEVEVKLNDIIVPVPCDGKIRCKEARVIREVPLEECGVYGKVLKKRRDQYANGKNV